MHPLKRKELKKSSQNKEKRNPKLTLSHQARHKGGKRQIYLNLTQSLTNCWHKSGGSLRSVLPDHMA